MTFKRFGILVILCGVSLNPHLHGQSRDSIQVSGHLKWRDSTIQGFPTKVKISSRYDPFYVVSAEVDSTGNFSVFLPTGSYLIELAVPYHHHDSFVRIDENRSKLFVELNEEREIVLPHLDVYTVEKPDLVLTEGILQDGFQSNEAQMIDDFIKANMSYYHVPGASFAIFKGGKVIHYGVQGVKNMITREPVDENTLFGAGSITKPIFAFVVMRLVENGLIDLDKPLYKYLTFEDVAHDERYKLITARFVLSHQSGLPNWATRNEQGRFDLLFKPGTKFGYSGEGFEYLKRVVEKATRKDIGTILQEEVRLPLGWEDVYFKTTEQVKIRISDGQNLDGFPNKAGQIDEPMMAFSMVAEARSFATFALALRNREGLKPATYDEMLKVQSTREDGINWGLGLRIEETDFGNAYGHSGYMPSTGFLGNYVYFPDLDMGYVIFTNSTTGWWLSIDLLKEYLITGKDK